MKKIKVIQYAMMFIALWTTLYLIDSIEVSKKEFIAAFVLVTVVSVNYICFRYYEDRKQIRIACEGLHCLILVFVMFI